ncbi:MFS transporter [Alicyclobacillus sp. ALC3]|uniref:MFS transporter n=1 Tax=Alicyclobacillus sp. ALC3 TaxID=2796143 RepID=UPI002378E9BB|nr:MFS transporter [Alicyclobacillus sp. ALC3]WDL97157.1 MFS transporter [Alicyclobacillus sp. ALC3]
MDNSSIKVNLQKSVMFGSFALGIMPFLLPVYGVRIGGNAETIGGLFSVVGLVNLVIQPLVGREVDHFGRRKFFVVSFLVYAISMVLYSFASTMPLLYVARVLQGIGGSFMWTAAYAIIGDITDRDNQGKSIGRVQGVRSTGRLYGAILGFIILGYFPLLTGWSVLFKVYACLLLYAGYIAYKYIPETVPKKEPKGTNDVTHTSTHFRKLLVVVFIGSLSTSMLSPLLMIFLQDRFTTHVGSLATAYLPAALIYAYLSVRMGRLSDKYNRIRLILVGLLTSGIVSLGFPNSPSIIVVSVLWAVESIGAVIATPAEVSLVTDMTGANIRGTAYGQYLATVSIGTVIGPLLGGWLYDRYNHSLPFYINGLLMILDGFVAVLLLRNYGSSTGEQPTASAE